MSQGSRSKADVRGSGGAASSDETRRADEGRAAARREAINLRQGQTLTGPGELKIVLESRLDASDSIGPLWVVRDAMGVDIDEIPELELMDETLWR